MTNPTINDVSLKTKTKITQCLETKSRASKTSVAVLLLTTHDNKKKTKKHVQYRKCLTTKERTNEGFSKISSGDFSGSFFSSPSSLSLSVSLVFSTSNLMLSSYNVNKANMISDSSCGPLLCLPSICRGVESVLHPVESQ